MDESNTPPPDHNTDSTLETGAPTSDMFPEIRLTTNTPTLTGSEFRFTSSFRIGRMAECAIAFESDVVSRTHAEVWFERGAWWVKDLDSRNGVFLEGHRVRLAALPDGATLTIGHEGPEIRVAFDTTRAEPVGSTNERPSMSHFIDRYFNSKSDRPAGRHTQMIRQAYAVVNQRQRKRFTWVVSVLAVVAIIGGSFGFWQRAHNQRMRVAAGDIFFDMKSLDVQTFEVRRALESQEGNDFEELLAGIEEQRRNLRSRYEGYIQDLGVYRKLRSEEERLIHRTARIFNESEFAMTADFVREVQEKIRYWQTTGREIFVEAIHRAEQTGYTPFIIKTLLDHGLPPEFYYLGLQESAFKPDQIGPRTRWGRAKGMWQFIPVTASEYGLDPGVRAHTAARDGSDDRQNFRLSTVAAARYLRDIHGKLTQASGLLVMAAYNWGEHRVGPRLDSLPTPREAFSATFNDVPIDPKSRNYWNFLDTYGNRIPSETRDYVLKIFAAATIGQNPRLFGFDFDNPIESYLP